MSNDDIMEAMARAGITPGGAKVVDLERLYEKTPRKALIKTIARLIRYMSGKSSQLEAKDQEVLYWRAFATAAAMRAGGIMHLGIHELAELTEEVEEKASLGCTVTVEDDGGVTLKVERRWASEPEQVRDRGGA